jgi:hypothetical protein
MVLQRGWTGSEMIQLERPTNFCQIIQNSVFLWMVLFTGILFSLFASNPNSDSVRY